MYSGPTCKVQDRVRGFFGATEVSKVGWGENTPRGELEGLREEGEEVAWLGLCSLSSCLRHWAEPYWALPSLPNQTFFLL